MHRCYVNFNWHINYSHIANLVNFSSPKAQLVIQKVSDLHKSNDIFMSSRISKIRELLVPYVKYCKENGAKTSAEGFKDWVNTMVKDPNFKLAILIESIFGTALWLFHAGSRENNFALTNAAVTVFSPLFHIMGNRNYSIIELYDLYVGRLCREKQPILADNLEKNTGVNLTNMPFASQPLDARHEEINKKGQIC